MTALELAQQLSDLLAAHLEITGAAPAGDPDPDAVAFEVEIEDAEQQGPLFARFRIAAPVGVFFVTVEHVPDVTRA